MRILTIIGTRPQLIKEAALQPALRRRHDEILVDTGQHYDRALAGDLVDELGLRPPDHALGIGGGSASEQVGRMLIALRPVIRSSAPDAVLVFGDTNSTLAGALAAAQAGLPVAHVEAGLRSFDRRMPEELNRVLADHLAEWLFVTTAAAAQNLAAEGIVRGVSVVGDLMHDLLVASVEGIRDPTVLAGVRERVGLGADGPALAPGRYLYATVHRAANQEPDALRAIAALLEGVASPSRPVIIALHPGTAASLAAAGVRLGGSTHVVPPVGYRDSLALQLHAAAVLTDSGGIQRESAWLGTPCLVLRDRTEWTELVGDPDAPQVLVEQDLARALSALAALAPDGARSAVDAAARAGSAMRPAMTAQRISELLADAGRGAG